MTASTNNKNATGVANKALATHSISAAKTAVAMTVVIAMVEMITDVILTAKTATAMTEIMMEAMKVATTEETMEEAACLVRISLSKETAGTNNNCVSGALNKTLASHRIPAAKMTVATMMEATPGEMIMVVIPTTKTARTMVMVEMTTEMMAMAATMVETTELAIMEVTTQEMARSVLPL